MSIYTPTYLYIKQHSITGKLYFGKTIKNPEKYMGSGTHWQKHIKKHGKEYVQTLWYCLFLDQESCTEFALSFSKQENIVESNLWLNVINENGIDGFQPGQMNMKGINNPMFGKCGVLNPQYGKPDVNSHRLGASHTNETKLKMSKASMNKPKSDEHRANISLAKQKEKFKCPHCERIIGTSANFHRHLKSIHEIIDIEKIKILSKDCLQ